MEYYLLHELSNIDKKMVALSKNKNIDEKKITLIKMKNRIIKLKDEYRKINESVNGNNSMTDEINNNVSSAKKELKNYENILYNTPNLKTIDTCQKKISTINDEIKESEDKEYALMIENEDYENRIKEIKKSAEILKGEFNSKAEELKTEELKLRNEKELLNKKRTDIERRIDKNFLMEYNILKEKYGYGMCEVESGICSGCNLQLPVNTIREAEQHKEFIKCPNCGRFLFID